MAKKTLLYHDYEAMVAAFRAAAPEYKHYTAAKFCDFDAKTLQKYWHEGNPKLGWDPIKTVIEAEVAKTRDAQLSIGRAKLHQKQREDEAQRAAALAARKQEQQIVSVSRQNTLAVLSASTSLVQNAGAVAEAANEAILEALNATDPADKLSAREAVELMERIASCQSKIIAMAKVSADLEKAVGSKPVEDNSKQENMTLDEAALRLARAQAALTQAQQIAGQIPIAGDSGTAAANKPLVGKIVQVPT